MHFSESAQSLLASLRGIRPESVRGRENSATGLDSLMEVLERRHRIGEGRPEQAVMAHWGEIMGAHNARRASPLRIERGRLLVQVSNPVLRRELGFHKQTILERLKKIPGCAGIREITFRAG